MRRRDGADALLRTMSRLCVLLAAVCFLVYGLTAIRTADARSGGVLLAAAERENVPDAADVERMREEEAQCEEPLGFTAWSQREETVMALDGCRRTQTDVIRICGSSEYLIPYGKILQEGDEEGCLIGRKTAETLFKSHNVTGLSVSCGGREYVVRGVLSAPEELLVIAGEETEAYDHITLDIRGGNERTAAEKFLARHGLSMQCMNRAGFRKTFSLTELLPGSWSDFAGWKQNFAAWREGVRQQEKIVPSVFELEAEEKKNMAVGAFATGALLFIYSSLGLGFRFFKIWPIYNMIKGIIIWSRTQRNASVREERTGM